MFARYNQIIIRTLTCLSASAFACFATASDPIVGPPIRIDAISGATFGNETTISASDRFPLEAVAGWNDYHDNGTILSGFGVTVDGGKTWSSFDIRPPQGFRSAVEGDPMTCYDPRTGTLWAGAISFGAGTVYVARKNQGENTFQPSVVARVGGPDKGWMAAGADPDDPNRTRVYIAYNEGLLVSTDMGDTWSSPRSLGPGLGFLPRVGPNGEVYVSYWDFVGDGTGVMLRRSFNGGTSFEPPIRIATRMDVWGIGGSRFPGRFRVPSLNALAVDPNDGTLYSIYFDTTDQIGNNRNVDLYFNKSTDRGSTWTTPRILNGDSDPPGDQFFPWMEVDRRGRIHVHFLDTRGFNQDDNGPVANMNSYYAYSDDAGDSWTEIQLTPKPFNPGTIFFLGDYDGLAVGGNRVYACYPLAESAADSDIYVNVIIDPTGDLNCDGEVNAFDIEPFLLALFDPDRYVIEFPDCDLLNGDTNDDGGVDAFDIEGFLRLLFS